MDSLSGCLIHALLSKILHDPLVGIIRNNEIFFSPAWIGSVMTSNESFSLLSYNVINFFYVFQLIFYISKIVI